MDTLHILIKNLKINKCLTFSIWIRESSKRMDPDFIIRIRNTGWGGGQMVEAIEEGGGGEESALVEEIGFRTRTTTHQRRLSFPK
jgi:hypothetical protein